MKRGALVLSGMILFLILVAFATLAPIDRAPLEQRIFYRDMLHQLDTLMLNQGSLKGPGPLQAGWSETNLTPETVMPMAGYRLRDSFDAVHDSLYARVLTVSNEQTTVYFITVDLLLMPREMAENIQDWLSYNEPGNTAYFSATHTHNGVGGWDSSRVGEIVLGEFHSDWVTNSTQAILQAMQEAKNSSREASLSYWDSEADDLVINRLVSGAPHDGRLRGLQVNRNDGSTALLFTFSAHPTSISQRSVQLSADYPGEVIKHLKKKGWDFAMFQSGMVGSHSLSGVDGSEFDRIAQAGEMITERIEEREQYELMDSAQITAIRIPLLMGESQLRIAPNWRVRNWLFRWGLGELEAELTYVKINNILFVGTSCDFSGEILVSHKLDSIAQAHNTRLIITSFNGYYTGYITADDHYDEVNKEEVRALNWVGPHFGEYYATLIKRLIQY